MTSSHLCVVVDLAVRPHVRRLRHEVAVDDRLYGRDLLEGRVKVRLHLLAQQAREPVAVVVVDESVGEDAQALVVPEAQQAVQVLKGPTRVSHQRSHSVHTRLLSAFTQVSHQHSHSWYQRRSKLFRSSGGRHVIS